MPAHQTAPPEENETKRGERGKKALFSAIRDAIRSRSNGEVTVENIRRKGAFLLVGLNDNGAHPTVAREAQAVADQVMIGSGREDDDSLEQRVSAIRLRLGRPKASGSRHFIAIEAEAPEIKGHGSTPEEAFQDLERQREVGLWSRAR